MKPRSIVILIIALFCFNTFHLLAQESIVASGANISAFEGSVSYTVGQVAFNVFSGINSSIIQGIQQTFEFSVVTAAENVSDINLKCRVYPNPTRNVIKLSIGSADLDSMYYRMYDTNSRLILDMKIENEETEISLQNLAPSIYFLRVIRNKLEIKTFKIIKY
jgi:hypothetical protein